MLNYIIMVSFYEEDIVLDCFFGFGSMVLVVKRNRWKCIFIDIDMYWMDYIEKRLNEFF